MIDTESSLLLPRASSFEMFVVNKTIRWLLFNFLAPNSLNPKYEKKISNETLPVRK